MVIIYPVVELKDLIYAYRYGWLDALVNVTEGVTLRPEQELGRVLRRGETVKQYLAQEWGLPESALNRLKIMLDHGINSPSFSRFFGLDKTPQNIVYVYYKLGVDYGVAFDVPVRLYLSAITDIAINEDAGIEIDESVKGVIMEIASIVRDGIRAKFNDTGAINARTKIRIEAEAKRILKSDRDVQSLVAELSRVGVEETVKRLKEMVKYADILGFKGVMPVIQGLNNDDIDHCIKNTIEIMSQYSDSFMIAIGTGGKVLSREDVERIKFAIVKIKEYAKMNNVFVKIHLLGWSSPNRLQDPDVLRNIYSADSLTVRRRAAEGKIFVFDNISLTLKLVPASQFSGHDFSCYCVACRNPILRSFILDPSGARRNDVRMVHNIYVLTLYVDKIMGR
jgi:hypothetical protein